MKRVKITEQQLANLVVTNTTTKQKLNEVYYCDCHKMNGSTTFGVPMADDCKGDCKRCCEEEGYIGGTGKIVPDDNPVTANDEIGLWDDDDIVADIQPWTEAWRVDAGGCIQCPDTPLGIVNPNCPFPTEQDCLNSLNNPPTPKKKPIASKEMTLEERVRRNLMNETTECAEDCWHCFKRAESCGKAEGHCVECQGGCSYCEANGTGEVIPMGRVLGSMKKDPLVKESPEYGPGCGECTPHFEAWCGENGGGCHACETGKGFVCHNGAKIIPWPKRTDKVTRGISKR